GRNRSLIEILVLRAAAETTGGAAAAEVLEGALHLAEPQGYLRVFLDEGVGIDEPLRQVEERTGSRRVKRFAKELLAARVAGARPPRAAQPGSPGPQTARRRRCAH